MIPKYRYRSSTRYEISEIFSFAKNSPNSRPHNKPRVLFSWILIRPPHVVVRSHFLLPHAATVRHRSLLGALRILELVPVQLGIKDAGQDAGRREVVAVILSESLLLVNGALRRARIRGQGSGWHVVLVPLTRRTRHQAAQRVERVGLARRRRVWDHWFRLEKKKERSTVAFSF